MKNITKFLKDWLSKEGIITSSDTEKLSRFMTELGIEIDKLSVDPPDGASNLILYGGNSADVPMWRIADGASKSGQGFYFISNTEAGLFLNNEECFDIIKEICDKDIEFIDRIYGNSVNGRRSAYVIEGHLTINDHVSANLAKRASGNVTIWAPEGKVNSVFSDTELRNVLTNSKITSINGIAKEEFINTYKL